MRLSPQFSRTTVELSRAPLGIAVTMMYVENPDGSAILFDEECRLARRTFAVNPKGTLGRSLEKLPRPA